MKKFKLSLLLTLTTFLAACSTSKTVEDPGAAFKGKSEKQIFTQAETAMKKGDYSKAIKAFEGLDALYPFGQYAQQGQLDIIYAYYKNDDAPSTLAAADRYIHLYPMGQHVDYAYYMRGLAEFYENRGFVETYVSTDYSQRNLTPLREAFADFSTLVTNYPNSIYTPDARLRMIYIRNMIAQHVLEVAHFYYIRSSYVAAANRASEVITRYQESTSVPGALVLLTEANIKLDYIDAAARSYHVLQLNYPDNPNLKDLAKKLNALQGK